MVNCRISSQNKVSTELSYRYIFQMIILTFNQSMYLIVECCLIPKFYQVKSEVSLNLEEKNHK